MAAQRRILLTIAMASGVVATLVTPVWIAIAVTKGRVGFEREGRYFLEHGYSRPAPTEVSLSMYQFMRVLEPLGIASYATVLLTGGALAALDKPAERRRFPPTLGFRRTRFK